MKTDARVLVHKVDTNGLYQPEAGGRKGMEITYFKGCAHRVSSVVRLMSGDGRAVSNFLASVTSQREGLLCCKKSVESQ